MKTLALLHTTPVTVASMKELATRLSPGTRVVNVLDDSLLPDVMRAGSPTPEVRERMAGYARAALTAGADAILCCCSSVGEVVEALRPEIPVPFLRVDEPMAREAARLAGEGRIGVIATVGSTLTPTANLVRREAPGARVEAVLVEGAFEALSAGDTATHDTLVTKALTDLVARVDVVVLAQASMARLLGSLDAPPPIPVLSSPESGLKRALEVLE